MWNKNKWKHETKVYLIIHNRFLHSNAECVTNETKFSQEIIINHT